MKYSLRNRMEKIYFYAPDKNTHYLFNHETKQSVDIAKVIRHQSSNFICWIATTYFHVKQAGFACEIIDYIPNEGIVIADRDTLDNKYLYLGKVMLICAKGDREFHPSAHLHVVQNPYDLQERRNLIWHPYFIPMWPQPSLIPRGRERGSLVENIAFIGTRKNLIKEFLSENWLNHLTDLGCKWHPVFDQNKWNDYSNIDVIVAVRSFDRCTYPNKPASKLINSWHGAVPAILAPEYAFIAERKSDLDFLIVNSIDETIEAVKQLKNNPELYLSMIDNGRQRAQEFTEQTITESWLNFFYNYVFPQYEKWLNMSDFQRRTLFVKRYIGLKQERMEKRINKFISAPVR